MNRQFLGHLPRALADNRPARWALRALLAGLVAILSLAAVIHLTISGILKDRHGDFTTVRALVSRRTAALFRDLEETAEARQHFRDVRLAPDGVATFLARLEQSATAAAVTQQVESLPLKEVAEPPAYPSPILRFRLTVEGPVGGILTYLRYLHDVPELLVIEEIRITSPQEEDLRVAAVADIRIAVAARE